MSSKMVRPVLPRTLVLALAAAGLLSQPVLADSTPQTLPLGQDWSNIGLIVGNDDWSAVPGVTGYRGDGLTGATAADPQTIVADGNGTPVDVNANQTNPDTLHHRRCGRSSTSPTPWSR
jgi:hypothetical protein